VQAATYMQFDWLRVRRSLGLLITNHCSAECDFCTQSSSPRDKRGLSIESCKSVVRDAALLGFNEIGISGGEPFLNFPKLLAIAHSVHEFGLALTVHTNCYWAVSIGEARARVLLLKALGLHLVNASYDESHASYVKSDYVENLLRACNELDVPIHLLSAYYRRGKRVEDYFRASVIRRASAVIEFPALRAKRNAARPDADFVKQDGLPEQRCPTPIQIVVNFDGIVYPCCSASGFRTHIQLGNISKNTIGECILAARDNLYLQYITRFGLASLVRKLFPEQAVGRRFSDVCELCTFVGTSEERFRIVQHEIERQLSEDLERRLDVLLALRQCEARP
jgi:MoaA/NifB/PqqE/SkfB family radical SAM enzyme